jgi:hypothetical protein
MTFRTFRIGGPHRAWQPGLYAGITREQWHLTRTASPDGWALWIGPVYVMRIR